MIMKHTLNIVLLASFLLLPVITFGQEEDTGVRVKKSVSPRNSDGSYTITLETYATGETEVEMTDYPADIVLILDLSTSMSGSRGSTQRVTTDVDLSYNQVNDALLSFDGPSYLWERENFNSSSDAQGDGTFETDFQYQLYGLYKNNRYYIYFIHPQKGFTFLPKDGSDNYYYAGTSAGNTQITHENLTPPDNAAYYTTSADGTFHFPANGHLFTGTSSRIRDLRKSLYDFIDEIYANATTKINPDGTTSSRSLNHMVAVVSFEKNTHRLIGLTSILDGVTPYKSIFDRLLFQLASGTIPTPAFQEANSILSVQSDRTRTIVFFTDGKPDSGNDINSQGRYDSTIKVAKVSKDPNGEDATVYTVAMLGASPQPGEATPIWEFMNYISSNYPNATGTNSPGDVEQSGYYFDVSDDNADLSSVFLSIASNIKAESDNPSVEAHTQVRDALSSSFTVPDGFDASKVVVYTVDIDRDGNWYPVPDHTVPAAPNDPTGHVVALTKVTTDDYLTDPTKVKVTTGTDAQGHNTVWVEGFDFVRDDSSLGAGDGNWVGQRYKNGQFFYAGKKLVIEFNIVTIGEATGGDDTSTNTADSGVYIMNPETGEYTSLINYEIPHTNLPINIIIKKKGLRHGQSATFQIETSPFLLDDNGDIVYNDIGKPASKYAQNAEKWDDLTKLIITNKGEDGAEVTKVLRSFEPDRVYRIREDDWGWSYTVIGNNGAVNIPNTSTVEVNPFVFENIENTNAVKHAEAVTINHFSRKGSPGTASVESYKSSKVESFTTPSDSGK